MVEKEFDDGWASGMNVRTGKMGMFPLSCVGVAGQTPLQQPAPSTSSYLDRSSRISSRYN